MPKLVADIEIPEDGSPPGIAYAAQPPSFTPVFVVVIPPNGSEEDARLFAVRTARSADGPVFHRGSRSEAAAVAYPVEPRDPSAVARLFGRGRHPGDFRLAGPESRGRAPTAALSFLDLSRGLPDFARLSTPWEMRLALAEACAEAGERPWLAAADVLDPAGLMRSGALVPPGGNPLTREGFDRFLRDGAARRGGTMDVGFHPIRDFRLLKTPEIVDEMVRAADAVLYGCPDLPPEGPATDLLKRKVRAFADAVRDGAGAEAAHVGLQTALALAAAPGRASRPIGRLLEGRGPGAVRWRDLFDPKAGLVVTLLRRVRSPRARNEAADAVAKLPEWAKRAVIDPASILAGRPATVELVADALGDRHRPYLALPASRMAASPETLARLAAMPAGHAESLLANTAFLLAALDEIENRHALLPEARDAVAVGWHALAHALAAADPDRAEALAGEAPAFVTGGAMARPFLAPIHRFHRETGGPSPLGL